jgi:TonB family protein
MLGPLLSCVLLLTLGFLQFSAAQEPSGKPESPTPKTTPALIPLSRNSSAGAAPEKPAPEPEAVVDLSALATVVAAHISVADCQPNACAVLVTNFTLPDGNTSAYGMQLADKLSRELTSREYKLQVIDRGLLQDFLTKDRIPAQSVNHGVIRSVADALDARFMVFGTTEKFDNGLVRLSSQLIDMTVKDWSGYNVIVNLNPLKSEENFEPVEPFAPLPGIRSSSGGENLQQAGVNGTGTPHCTYMPNPAYTEGARKLNLRGRVTVEAVINSQGRMENIRVVRGLPGGLNEQTISAMQTWRCGPALKDDKPVPTLVQFTVSFRLY